MPDYDLAALEKQTRSSKYPGKPFGYEYNMDMREIEGQMIAEGYLRGSVSFLFEGATRYGASKRGDLSMRQRQDLAKWLGLRWAGRSAPAPAAPNTQLTLEDLRYIAARLNGSNDDRGFSILAKLKCLLEERNSGDSESLNRKIHDTKPT
jgi:hypothetical protein